jgi:multisubunit Na+/H+ antiporter MnhB subunit
MLIKRFRFKKLDLLLITPFIASIIFWFFTAPDIRFAGSLFWCLASILIMLFLRTYPWKQKIIPVVFIVLCYVWLVAPMFQLSSPKEIFTTLAVPYTQTIPFTTHSGLVVNTLISGDQCWNIDLPCTPYARDGLMLINKDNILDGFKITENKL